MSSTGVSIPELMTPRAPCNPLFSHSLIPILQKQGLAGMSNELVSAQKPSAQFLFNSEYFDDELPAMLKDELGILNRIGRDLLEVLDAYPPLEDASIRITAIDMHWFSTSFSQELLYL